MLSLFFLFTTRFISDMEEEYFPTISMNTASNRGEPSSSLTSTSTVILKKNNLVPGNSEDCPEIKDEPISEPPSPCIPCQSSCDMVDDKSTITMVPAQSLHYVNGLLPHTSDSEEEDEDCDMVYQYGAILYDTHLSRDKVTLKSTFL